MGYVIVMIVGAVLGWLAAIVVDRDDRVGTLVCVAFGLVGGVAAALLAGDVPLAIGVSAIQLLWSVLGALLTIVAINALCVSRLPARSGNV